MITVNLVHNDCIIHQLYGVTAAPYAVGDIIHLSVDKLTKSDLTIDMGDGEMLFKPNVMDKMLAERQELMDEYHARTAKIVDVHRSVTIPDKLTIEYTIELIED